MVDTNNLAWKSCRFDRTEVADTLGAPRFAVRFSICATGTKGRRYVGEFMGDDVSTGEKLKLGEAEVAESLMVDKKGVLFTLSVGKRGVDRESIGSGEVGGKGDVVRGGRKWVKRLLGGRVGVDGDGV